MKATKEELLAAMIRAGNVFFSEIVTKKDDKCIGCCVADDEGECAQKTAKSPYVFCTNLIIEEFIKQGKEDVRIRNEMLK